MSLETLDTPEGFRIEEFDGVVVVSFDRPQARNALTAAMRRDFGLIFAELDRSEECRCIVLTGTDPSFTAGVDLKERLAGNTPPPRVKPNPGEVLRSCSTPVIAAVNGPCVTGGLEIALSCTFIVASELAVFRDTHARLSIMPGWGLSALLPRAVGGPLAREMTLTGRTLDASEALAAGLVNRVVPHDQLVAEALASARLIADAQPRVVSASLALYRRGESATLADALQFEQEAADAWRTDSTQSRADFDRLTGH